MDNKLSTLKNLIQNNAWEKASEFILNYEQQISILELVPRYCLLKGAVLEYKDQGLDWWIKSLDLFPENIPIRKRLINNLLSKNEFEKVFLSLIEASRIFPQEQFFFKKEVELHIKLDDRSNAFASSLKYRNQFPNSSFALLSHIRCLLLLKRREEAIHIFESERNCLHPKHLLEILALLNQNLSIEKLCKQQIRIGDDILFWKAKEIQNQLKLYKLNSEIENSIDDLVEKVLIDTKRISLLVPSMILDPSVEKKVFQKAESLNLSLSKSFINYKEVVVGVRNKETTYKPVKNKKIDLVYTWVDMSDPAFLAKFKKVNGFYPDRSTNFQQNAVRYTNHDEIKFSLKTVQKYFSDVNHIYIVTNDQAFDIDFLEEKFQKKVSFINQDDIIPRSLVPNPTFNSNLIESFIWNIPNLSETFMYFCDDYFLGSFIELNRHIFSDDNIPMTLLAPHAGFNHSFNKALLNFAKSDTKYKAFNHNAYQVYSETVGTPPPLIDLHLPMILRKEACKEAFKRFAPIWEKAFFSNSLRTNTCCYSLLMYNWFAINMGYQKVGPYHLYKQDSLIFNNGLNEENYNILMHKRPLFFCINFLPDHESQDIFQRISSNYLESS